jgi:2-(1,2-epoxy-1,2-dihydrophenyl)acetyl-CoA isomerase
MVGSPLDGGSSYALTCAIGPAAAMSLLLGEDSFSADDLHRFGLAGKPVASGSFDEETARFADRIAKMDAGAVVASRSLLRRGLSFDEQWDAEVACLRSFVESGRLAQGLGQYWSGRK